MSVHRKRRIWENVRGYLFISPVMLGILIFTVIPLLYSIYYSFTDYSILNPTKFVGFDNYTAPFTIYKDDFYRSIRVTLLNALFSIPISMVLVYLLSLLLNSKIRFIKFFQKLYYIPVLIPTVVSGLVWRNVIDVKFGLGNRILTALGFEKNQFFNDPRTALPTLIFLGLFGLGGGVILYLANFKNIPVSLYESAELDGAGSVRKALHITFPMSTPIIFYNLILSIIGSLQVFANVFVITGGTGGAENSLMFYVFHIYVRAFLDFKFGLACALSWILFIVIAILTFVVFKTSRWVFYGEDSH